MDERNSYRNPSISGSLAYDLDALARELQLDEAGTMPEHRTPAPQPQPQRRVHEAHRPSPLLAGSLLALCVMVVVLMFGYVQLTTVSGRVSSLKNDIARLTDENVTLTTEYERTFDLATIKAVAEENGMSKPSSGQIEYIDLGGQDTAVVYAGVNLTESRVAASLSDAAHWLWEYFR